MCFNKFDVTRNLIFLLSMFLTVVHSKKNKVAVGTDVDNMMFSDVTRGLNSFSVDLYKILSETNPDTSILTSPISLQLVLALIYMGAHGETAKQISDALQLPSNDVDSVLKGHHSLVNALKDPELQVLTKLFVARQIKVKEDFQMNAVNYFESAVENVDFSSDTNVTSVINNWVEEKTNGKIKHLVTSDIANANTVMVLISVIHFKASWHMTFPESEIYKGEFYITEDEVNNIDMMAIYDEKFRYLAHPGLKAKMLEIPYKNYRFSMYIILPNAIDGLSELEKALDKINIFDEFKNLEYVSVDITLPKFKFTQTIDYKTMLEELGITAMFAEADFSGISNESLIVSNILQNTFIEVNENGTEAAAGTGLSISLRSFEIKAQFIADHPFLFLITKSLNNKRNKPLTLFIGKFNSK